MPAEGLSLSLQVQGLAWGRQTMSLELRYSRWYGSLMACLFPRVHRLPGGFVPTLLLKRPLLPGKGAQSDKLLFLKHTVEQAAGPAFLWRREGFPW